MDVLTKILNAATELFRQYGFKTITMDDISRRAGISKKTLYQHFANKQEVIHESLATFMEHSHKICIDIRSNATDAVEEMMSLIELFDQNQRNTNVIAFLELQRYYPDEYEMIRQQLLEKNVAIIRDNILRGMETGLYRDGLNADLMARFHIEVSLMSFQPNLMVNDLIDFKYVTREINEHFIYGLLSTAGKKLYEKYKAQSIK